MRGGALTLCGVCGRGLSIDDAVNTWLPLRGEKKGGAVVIMQSEAVLGAVGYEYPVLVSVRGSDDHFPGGRKLMGESSVRRVGIFLGFSSSEWAWVETGGYDFLLIGMGPLRPSGLRACIIHSPTNAHYSREKTQTLRYR